MNKRFLSILLSALLAANISACSPVYEKEIDADPPIENTDPNPSDDQPSDDEIPLPSVGVYQGVLDLYRDLLLLKKGHSNYFELYAKDDKYDNEFASEVFHAVLRNYPEKMGYCLTDLNSDGVDELILMDENYHIYTIFTATNSQVKIIEYARFFGEVNDTGAIGPDGTIYKAGYGKGNNLYKMIKKISKDGKLVGLEFGCRDTNVDGVEVEYYKIINGVRTVISYNEFDALNKEYYRIVGNHTDLTRSSGIQFTRMTLGRASDNGFQ